MRLLKPCKVKRFLATAALSEVGLVTPSSDPDGKQGDETDGQKELRKKVSWVKRENQYRGKMELDSLGNEKLRHESIIRSGKAQR